MARGVDAILEHINHTKIYDETDDANEEEAEHNAAKNTKSVSCYTPAFQDKHREECSNANAHDERLADEEQHGVLVGRNATHPTGDGEFLHDSDPQEPV